MIDTSRQGSRIRPAVPSRATVVLILVNLVGVVLYLRLAAYGWADPAERAAGITTLTGEPVVWFLAVAPVLAVYFVINATWLFAVLVRGRRRSAIPLALTAALWAVAATVDFAHH